MYTQVTDFGLPSTQWLGSVHIYVYYDSSSFSLPYIFVLCMLVNTRREYTIWLKL